MYAGYDAAVGLSFLSEAGNEPFVKSPSWKVAEAHIYKAPQSIKFETASSETAVAGTPIDASFRVKDILPAFNQEVNPAFPLTVKFETNSGTLSKDFTSVDTSTGLATITWTPSNETSDNKDPYLLAMMHDHNGQVIAADRWTPEKGETTCPDANHPHMIDLGLPSGTKWACCNVGAFSPEDAGCYFSWGEVSEKSSYHLYNYLYWNDIDSDGYGTDDEFVNIGNEISGTDKDAVKSYLGTPWSMPTLTQAEELVQNCEFSWISYKGQNGVRIHGRDKNGKDSSIFIPAVGYKYTGSTELMGQGGSYWTGTLYPENSKAYQIDFGTELSLSCGWGWRANGQPIRPVCK